MMDIVSSCFFSQPPAPPCLRRVPPLSKPHPHMVRGLTAPPVAQTLRYPKTIKGLGWLFIVLDVRPLLLQQTSTPQ